MGNQFKLRVKHYLGHQYQLSKFKSHFLTDLSRLLFSLHLESKLHENYVYSRIPSNKACTHIRRGMRETEDLQPAADS